MSLKGSNKTDYQRDYMRDKRKRKALQREEVFPKNVTQNVTLSHNVHQSIMLGNREVTPSILDALVTPSKREKLERIYKSLGPKAEEVYYGVSGITMADIGGLLEATT